MNICILPCRTSDEEWEEEEEWCLHYGDAVYTLIEMSIVWKSTSFMICLFNVRCEPKISMMRYTFSTKHIVPEHKMKWHQWMAIILSYWFQLIEQQMKIIKRNVSHMMNESNCEIFLWIRTRTTATGNSPFPISICCVDALMRVCVCERCVLMCNWQRTSKCPSMRRRCEFSSKETVIRWIFFGISCSIQTSFSFRLSLLLLLLYVFLQFNEIRLCKQFTQLI